jgi:hypothetical protein
MCWVNLRRLRLYHCPTPFPLQRCNQYQMSQRNWMQLHKRVQDAVRPRLRKW